MMSRLMTRREQALLAGLALALLTGSIVLYLHDRNPDPPQAEARTEAPQSQPGAPSAAPQSAPAGSVNNPRAAAPDPVPVKTQADPPLTGVAVMGAVCRKGMYYLPPGSRITHLIEKAGGALENADLSGINTAARLIDGTTLTIPFLVEGRRRDNAIHMAGPDTSLFLNPPEYLQTRFQPRNSAPGSGAIPPAPLNPATASGIPGNGRINLNTADAEELTSLPGIGKVLAERIIDERRQAPFTSVDDLRRVSGIAEGRISAVRSLVSVQ